MKTIRILIVIYLCFYVRNSVAQESRVENYQKISGITKPYTRSLDCTKLATISGSSKLAVNEVKPYPKKKIKPYESNKSSIFDNGWFKAAGTSFNAYKNQYYRFPETSGQNNNSQYPVKPSTKK